MNLIDTCLIDTDPIDTDPIGRALAALAAAGIGFEVLDDAGPQEDSADLGAAA